MDIDLIGRIRRELKEKADPATKESGKHYFKEKIKLYGVKTAVVQKIAKEHFKKIGKMSKNEIFNACELLWRSGYMEESFIACNWAEALHERYEEKDLKVFESWLKKYVSNWAACDTLCNHTIGTFLEMYPTFLTELREWAGSANRWLRRAAAVSLIIPARRGKFLKDILELADILLLDKDDLVQKGYGWMLKAASHAHQREVFAYVLKNKQVMPRTALRYAIEKMPMDLKQKAMRK
jgi:3-methyladenine DNA glycosylase AlkD